MSATSVESATTSARRPVAVTSALLIPVERAVDIVLDFAANPGDEELAVAVSPERIQLLAERIEAEAGRRRVPLDADIHLVQCADRDGLLALLRSSDRRIDSGCPYLAEAHAPAPGGDASVRTPLDLIMVGSYPSDPPRNGGGMRIHSLWGAMPADVGARGVALAHFDGPAAAVPLTRARPGLEHQVPFWPELLARIREVTALAGTAGDDLGLALAATGGDPFSQALARELNDCANGVVLSHPFLVRQVASIAPALPIVYEAHNVEFDLKSAMYRTDAGGRSMAKLVAELEAEACARATIVVSCTEDDRNRLAELYDVDRGRIHIIPNGVSLEDAVCAPWAERARRAPRCVFAGSAHQPNARAASVVIEAAAVLPDVGFDIIGDVASVLRTRDLPANTVLRGRVSGAEKQRLFCDATLALNPMLSGSGSNLKVADYVASGLPVLSSPVGARGFTPELVDCFQIVEPTPETLAASITSALQRDWTDATVTARAIVESEYDWRALALRYADLLHGALSP